jgi:hypothetical protein
MRIIPTIFLMLVCICIPVCSAAPLPAEGAVLQRVSTEYYGTAYYVDKQPIMAGTEIIAKNQMNDTMGRYVLSTDGIYGCEQSYCKNFNVFYYVNASDKTSVGAQMYVSFFINGMRARPIVTFKENDLAKIDLIFPMTSPTPIPTQEPTTIITTIPSVTATTHQTASVTPTHTEIPSDTPSNQIPPLVLYGIIGGVIVLVGLVITALAYKYLYDKSDRDMIVKPD